MIKCNRCGKMTPAGNVCQSCGTPLTGMVENGAAPKMGFQDQPELPAWLESLRAGERPAAPTNSPSSFSPADLVEEGAFPSWMRSERGDARDNTASNPPVSARSVLPNQQDFDNGGVAPLSITANSLIDEKALPSWMQEGKQSAASPSAPINLSASSLVQSDNVPDWMRTLQQQQPSAPKNQSAYAAQPPKQAPPSEPPASPAAPLGSGFLARDLIDQQSLPSWMSPQNERGTDTGNLLPPQQTGQGTPVAGPNGFAASSLLDADALPQWMREGGQPSSQYARLNNASTSAAQSASWPTQPPTRSAWSANPAEMQQLMQTPPVNTGGQPGNASLAASSFIDTSSLPEWLRSASDQPQQQMGPGSRPSPYAVPPRAENMRVPSRPRGEVNSTESSELAANVFASMLGVASAAPNYPAQPQTEPPAQGNPSGPNNQPGQANQYGQIGQQDQGSLYGQSNQPGQANQYGQIGQQGQGSLYGQSNQQGQANAYGQMGQGAAMNQPGSMGQSGMSQASMSGMPNQGGVPNTPTGMNNTFPQNYGANSNAASYGAYGNPSDNGQGQINSALGNSMSGMFPMGGNSTINNAAQYSGNAMPASPAQSYTADGAGEQKNNKKRGLFEAIREWISRS